MRDGARPRRKSPLAAPGMPQSPDRLRPEAGSREALPPPDEISGRSGDDVVELLVRVPIEALEAEQVDESELDEAAAPAMDEGRDADGVPAGAHRGVSEAGDGLFERMVGAQAGIEERPVGSRRGASRAGAHAVVNREDHVRFARLHLRTGSLLQARSEFEALAACDLLDVPATLDLAEVRWRTGDLVGAGMAAAIYLAANGEEVLGFLIAAEAAAAEDRTVEARRHAGRALERSISNLERFFAGVPRRMSWPESSWSAPADMNLEPPAIVVPVALAAPVAAEKPAAAPEGSLWAQPEESVVTVEVEVAAIAEPAVAPEAEVAAIAEPAVAPEAEAVAVEAPAVEPQAVAAETPETPAVEPVEAPEAVAAETPAVEPEAVAAETPAVEPVEAPEAEAVAVEAPEAEAVAVEAPETPAVEPEAVAAEAPETPAVEPEAVAAETPETPAVEPVEAPEAEAVAAEAPETLAVEPVEAPEAEAVAVEAPTVEQAVEPAVEPVEAPEAGVATVAQEPGPALEPTLAPQPPLAPQPEPVSAPESLAPAAANPWDGEIRAGAEALESGDALMAALHFALALRISPESARAVIDDIGERSDLALELVRGDALRVLANESAGGRANASVASRLGRNKPAVAPEPAAPEPAAPEPAAPEPAAPDAAPEPLKPQADEPPSIRWE
ncbi:MAG: hypothetical protein ABSD62_08995 [Candidatus Limnocylindrales bacterium]